MTISLRAATIEDAPALSTLHETCFGGVDAYVQPWNEDDFREFLKFSNYCGKNPFLVAEKDDQIAGFLMAHFDADRPFESTVMTIDVDPLYRGQNIASSLLQTLEDHIRDNRTFNLDTRINAAIHVENWPSRRLFSSFGYAATGIQKGYYSDSADGLTVQKTIPATPKHHVPCL